MGILAGIIAQVPFERDAEMQKKTGRTFPQVVGAADAPWPYRGWVVTAVRGTPVEGRAAFRRTKTATKVSVNVMRVYPCKGRTTRDCAWWEIGTPVVLPVPGVTRKHIKVKARLAAQGQGR